MPPNSLKLTQTSVEKLKAMNRFRKPMKMKKTIQDRLTLLQTASGRVNCSPSMSLMAFFFMTSALKPMLMANTQYRMVGFHLMKVSSWKISVRLPKTTTSTRLTQSILSTLPWRNQTQAIWATVAAMTTTVASRIGACLMSTAAEPSREPTQLAASSGFFSEYLKATKKRMTGKRSKSSFMAEHYILAPATTRRNEKP